MVFLAQLRKPAFRVVCLLSCHFINNLKNSAKSSYAIPHHIPLTLLDDCNWQLLNLGQRYIFTDNYFLAYVIRKSSPSPPLLNTFWVLYAVSPFVDSLILVSTRFSLFIYSRKLCIFIMIFAYSKCYRHHLENAQHGDHFKKNRNVFNNTIGLRCLL